MKKIYVVILIGMLAWVLEMPACTDAALEGLPPPPPAVVDDKLEIEGEVCTENPEDLVFPVRVLFLVDCSESMEVNDPPDPATGETGRERAVRETAEELLTGRGDVEISVVRFSAESIPLTMSQSDDGLVDSYFTSDLDFLTSSLNRLRETDRTTNFIASLAEAYAEIRAELTHAEQESLALSTYHVIMITDGLPDVEGDETRENSAENLLDSVEGITDLGRLFHVGKMSVSTALISSGSAEADSAAEDLLKSLAEQGNGSYRSFASGGELNFVFVDLSALRRVFTLKTLIAENVNTVVDEERVVADSDGDGLQDWLEEAIGSDPYDPDSDGDGCRDGMEFRFRSSGMDPIHPGDCSCYVPDFCFDENGNGLCDCGDEPEGSCCTDADLDGLCDCIDENGDGRCDPSNYSDADGDGLFDCEERYTGTNRSGPDSDGDGLLDFLEIRFGTSPDIDDIADDFDWDAVPNGEEVKTATDPRYTSISGRSNLAYRYKVEEIHKMGKETGEAGSTCYRFAVSNITLRELMGEPEEEKTGGPGAQGFSSRNRVLIYAGEVPFDDLESYARFRVACVEATFRIRGNYKSPPSGLMQISDDDFVSLVEFNPEVDCIPPGGRR